MSGFPIIFGGRLLSVFAGAAAAYSARIPAGSTYNGPLLRVRRSSDNAEQDIGALAEADANGNRWLNADALLNFTGRNIIGGTNIASWSVDGTSTLTANAGVNSQGANTAVKLTENTNNSPHYANVAVVQGRADGRTYWFAVEIKADGRSIVRIAIELGAVSPNATIFDLSSGAVTFGPGLIENLGGGWFRCFVPFVGAVGAGFYLPRVYLRGASGDAYVGDGFSGVLIDRAMLQADQRTAHESNQAASAFVTTWYGQSGMGVNATQTTAASQPRIVDAGVVQAVNGRPSVRFDNSNLVVGTSFSTAHMLGVFNWTAALPFPVGQYRGLIGFDGPSNILFGVPGSSTSLSSAMSNGTVRINGTQTTTTNPALLQVASVQGTSFTGIWRVGRGDASTNFWVGNISEMVVFSSQLATLDRTALERNQGAAFGITVA